MSIAKEKENINKNKKPKIMNYEDDLTQSEDTNHIVDISSSTIRSDKLLNESKDYASTQQNPFRRDLELDNNDFKPRRLDLQQIQGIQQDAFKKQGHKLKHRLTMIECLLCSQGTFQNQLVNISKCDHLFCLSCSVNFIKQSLKNFTIINCPFQQCGAPLDSKSVILSYLTADQLEKIERIYNEEKLPEKQGEKIEQEQIEIEIEQSLDQQKSNKDDKIQSPHEHPKIQERKKSKQEQIQEKQTKNKNNNYDEPPVIRMTSSVLKMTRSPQKSTSMGNSEAFMKQSPSKSVHGSVLIGIKKQEERKQKQFKKQQEVKKQKELQMPFVPKKLFKFMSTSLWSDQWLRFFLMFPISILALGSLMVLTLIWIFLVALYFLLIWMIFIPIVWSIDEIWNCFVRSIENKYLRVLVFLVCIFGLPLIIIFFYFVTNGIIFYYSLFKPDMNQILQGKIPLILSCRKVYLNQRYALKTQCRCKINKKCQICRSRRPVMCCLII